MISLIAGIVVMASPFESIVTLALVVGSWFVVIGAFEAAAAFGIYGASKKPARRVRTRPKGSGGRIRLLHYVVTH